MRASTSARGRPKRCRLMSTRRVAATRRGRGAAYRLRRSGEVGTPPTSSRAHAVWFGRSSSASAPPSPICSATISCIAGAGAAGQHRADIAEHGGPQFVGQLLQILMRDGQGQPVFARLRQDQREAVGREGLELVGIEMEHAPLFGRHVGARQSRLRDCRGQQGAEQMRGAFAVAGGEAGADRGDRGSDGRGQDHAGEPDHAVLRARRAAGSPSTASTSPR